MKHLLFFILSLSCAMTVGAVDSEGVSTQQSQQQVSLGAIKVEKGVEADSIRRLKEIWGKRTFFNISYNSTEMSSMEFPSGAEPFYGKYKKDFGVGIQMGQTFNFHKNPLGSVLFIGLDYTWIDLNFNSYKDSPRPDEFPTVEEHMAMKNPLPLPWHQSKMQFDYGMSLGPALTFYPLISLHKEAAQKLRLHLYFHVGYCVAGTLIDMKDYKKDTTKDFVFGHGLFTSFGASLTWNFVGIGFDVRNDGSVNYKPTHKVYDTGKMKVKQKSPRVYLQFRF